MQHTWEYQLFSAGQAIGLRGISGRGGLLTLACPCCPSTSAPLVLDEGEAICSECSFAAKGEPHEIVKAIKAAEPEEKATEAASGRGLPLWTLKDILSHTSDPNARMWEHGALLVGLPAAIVGAPGVGKSRISLQAAVCTILGRPFLGWETRGKGKRWLFLQTENNGDRLKFDLQRMTALLSPADIDLIDDCLRIVKIDVLEFASVCMVEGHPVRTKIEETIEDWPPDVVVVDPMRDAGRGDHNKDDVMIETCTAIGQVVKRGNPRRIPLIIQHGRTGKAEGSKVYGDDAASFGRNSKALVGWLRSQINVAEAGIDYPDTIIVGCGKCSDGRKWEPFAAVLDDRTMMYRRLSKEEFDVREWGEEAASAGRGVKQARKIPPPDEVMSFVARSKNQQVKGGISAKDGLVRRLQKTYGLTQQEAIRAAAEAVEKGLDCFEERTPGKKGPATVVYALKSNSSNSSDELPDEFR